MRRGERKERKGGGLEERWDVDRSHCLCGIEEEQTMVVEEEEEESEIKDDEHAKEDDEVVGSICEWRGGGGGRVGRVMITKIQFQWYSQTPHYKGHPQVVYIHIMYTTRFLYLQDISFLEVCLVRGIDKNKRLTLYGLRVLQKSLQFSFHLLPHHLQTRPQVGEEAGFCCQS